MYSGAAWVFGWVGPASSVRPSPVAGRDEWQGPLLSQMLARRLDRVLRCGGHVVDRDRSNHHLMVPLGCLLPADCRVRRDWVALPTR